MNKEIFDRGISEIIDAESFEQRAKSQKLRIKYGVDPTKPDIHLGHAVVMRKLKQLQDDGHTIIFLIGDYTTKIGDPSGRNTTRPVLTDEEIKTNAKTYLDQAGKILDINKTEIRYNSEWFSKMTFAEVVRLTGQFTVAQIIERDDFQKRLKSNTDIGLHELLYPVMQAYDSVALKADVEFGGSDQKFNLLAGRVLQKKMGQIPQELVITDLLVGLDGKTKMSKSANNYISITESANLMYGKIMSIPDDLIVKYFELVTDLSNDAISEIKSAMEKGQNPKEIKMQLAREIVILFHTKEEAEKAEAEFVNVFSNKNLPTEIPQVEIMDRELGLIDLITKLDSTLSRSEARRLIEQGSVKINDEKIIDFDQKIEVKSDLIVKIGKLKIFQIKKSQ